MFSFNHIDFIRTQNGYIKKYKVEYDKGLSLLAQGKIVCFGNYAKDKTIEVETFEEAMNIAKFYLDNNSVNLLASIPTDYQYILTELNKILINYDYKIVFQKSFRSMPVKIRPSNNVSQYSIMDIHGNTIVQSTWDDLEENVSELIKWMK